MHCNDYQLTLYHQLMDLVGSNAGGQKSFVYKDHELRVCTDLDTPSRGVADEASASAAVVEHYRIFSYRWNPRYDDWCRPGALECRGIMYQLVDGLPHRLAAHPMEKFFNWHENPFTQSIDLSSSSKVDCIEDKVDGSLISTFLTSTTTAPAPDAALEHTRKQQQQQLKLKTKASLSSPQVVEATQWLGEAPQRAFCQELQRMAATDRTVNMEWVSPSNRIVVRYSQPELRVLNIRSNAYGSYLDKEDLPVWATQLSKRWTRRFEIPTTTCRDDNDDAGNDPDLVSILKSTSQETEGFVLRLKDSGMRIKVKTDWYLQQVQASKKSSSSKSSS